MQKIWFVLLLSALTAGLLPALDWEQGEGFRAAKLAVVAYGHPGFRWLPPQETGIGFTNHLAQQRYLTNQIYLNGSGVAAGDVDGDGWCDLYFCGLDGPNRLYRNLGGWKFKEVTDESGVACAELDATGAVFCDLDGDGSLDLIVNSVGGGTHIFWNDRQGKFRPASPHSLNPGKCGSSLALADIDGDGDLDLYLANYRTSTIRDHPNTKLRVSQVGDQLVVRQVNGRPVTEPDLVGRFTLSLDGKIMEHGEIDALYRNHGKGRFSLIAFTDGTFLDPEGKPLTDPPYDWGLSVMFRDLNGDRAPDIYVCNDFESEDRIWINSGSGQFQAIPRLALRTTSMFSMGVDFADLDRDGWDEIFVADMLSRDHPQRHLQVGDIRPRFLKIGEIENRPQYSRNTLFLNRGDRTYAEIAHFSGVPASEWSWTPIFVDVDLDGYEDLLITTGHELDMMNADVTGRLAEIKAQSSMSIQEQLQLRKMFRRLDSPIVAFRNRGDLTFEDVGNRWGFDHSGISHGMALADLDNDGDLDLAVNNLNAAAGIYRNESSAPRLAVRLRGNPPNTQGIGAKIRIFNGPVPQTQEMICGGRYLSGDDPMRVFAAGAASNALTIEVLWRSGKRSVVANAMPNHIYLIEEPGESVVRPQLPAVNAHASRLRPLFQDASHLLNHTHHEDPFDDFARQPLLPSKRSQLGPGVSWFDIDGDGWDDLIIGSGCGGRLALFRNNQKGEFQPIQSPLVNQPVTRDQTGLLGWRNEAGATVILAGSANYEDGLDVGSMVRQYILGGSTIDDSLPGQKSSTGPLALADIDADGDLDLFVGGRMIPAAYPQAASSVIYRNSGGRWVADQENCKRLANIGLVSGAVFSDLDGDGLPELVLACEYGPVRVLANQGGRLEETTERWGLSSYRGLWNGVTSGDFDGDGRMDLVASNWGLNTGYRASKQQPHRLYWGDLDANGTMDVVETYYAGGKEVPWRGFKAVGGAMPFLRQQVVSFEAYGKAGVQELYWDRLGAAALLEVETLSSMVFMNRGGRMEGRPLPWVGQLAPGFGVCVGDMDGDGAEDLFLSQNFFATNPETPRHDAGRGLWLRGDGRGGMEAVSGQESGVKVYGEQRGCALGDWDRDGRIDLVVAQNGNRSHLYRNVGAKAGLRVRLRGPAGNPEGVGAMVRVVYGDRMGPAREIHAGSGYWSQDASAQVVGLADNPSHLWVRWPGGNPMTVAIPPGAKEISVDPSGKAALVL